MDSFADFCSDDLHPFDVVSGKGFTCMAQGLVNIGACYGIVLTCLQLQLTGDWNMTDQIVKCKSLVAYLKKSGGMLSLLYAVLQKSETRWNSKTAMLNSVAKQHRKILELRRAKRQDHCMECIQVEVLNITGEILSFLQDASEDMEGDHHSKIHTVLL